MHYQIDCYKNNNKIYKNLCKLNRILVYKLHKINLYRLINSLNKYLNKLVNNFNSLNRLINRSNKLSKINSLYNNSLYSNNLFNNPLINLNNR